MSDPSVHVKADPEMAKIRAGVGVRRFDCWLHRKGSWDGRRPSLGADEYGRKAIVFPLPQKRALTVTYRVCRCDDCCDMREQTERQRRVNADPRTARIDKLITWWREGGGEPKYLPRFVGLTPEQYEAWIRGDGLPDDYVPPAELRPAPASRSWNP